MIEQYRLYDEFAPFHDRDWAKPYLADAEKGFDSCLIPLISEGGRVLDLCCGSGRLAGWLVAKGFRVTGLDGSDEMLQLARERVPGAIFLSADARDFRVDEPFDAVISTFDSVNHLATIDEVRVVFGNVAAALVPGGYFFFDVNTVEGFEEAGDESYLSIQDNKVCFVRSLYDSAANVGVSHVVIFRREGELYRRVETKIREYFHPIRELSDALEEAGFETPRTLDAWEDLAMPRAAGRLFLLARKQS